MLRSLSVLFFLCAAPALAQAPGSKLQSSLQNLQISKQQEAKLKKELDTTAADLRVMRSRATDLAASLQRSEANANRAEKELGSLNDELARTEREFDARKGEYARTIASILRMKNLPPTAMFSDKKSTSELVQTSRVLQNTNAALATRAKELRREAQRLKKLQGKVAARKVQVAKERVTLNEKQKQLATDLLTRQRLQERLERDHSSARAQVSKLSRESASLQELIGKLERAPQIAKKASPSPSATLGSAKGRAQLPVVGNLLHAFGEKKNSNETYRGMVLSARSGATVVAPYAGEVVFTGSFMNYGRMVLLKHGDGFISLLAGLGDISVGLNQQLGKGEPIGIMGGAKPSLYVELREHSKPIDPSTWFAKLPLR